MKIMIRVLVALVVAQLVSAQIYTTVDPEWGVSYFLQHIHAPLSNPTLSTGALTGLGCGWYNNDVFVGTQLLGAVYRVNNASVENAPYNADQGSPYKWITAPTPIPGSLNNIVQDKSGGLWISTEGAANALYRIDPVAKTVLKTVFLPAAPLGLTLDPVRPDSVYFGARNQVLYRIDGLNSASPNIVQAYVVTNCLTIDGIAAAADGHVFVSAYTCEAVHEVDENGVFVKSHSIASAGASGQVDGIAVSGDIFLVSTTGGQLVLVNRTSGFTKKIADGGGRGDMSCTGPDGCMYVNVGNALVRVGLADGRCPFDRVLATDTGGCAGTCAQGADRTGDNVCKVGNMHARASSNTETVKLCFSDTPCPVSDEQP